MTAYTFKYIEMANITEAEVIRRAKDFVKRFEKRFGKGSTDMQSAIDAVIDAAIEFNQ